MGICLLHVKRDTRQNDVFDDFMRNSDFGMLMSNIDVFFVTSFLCSLKFLLCHRIEYPKRCL